MSPGQISLQELRVPIANIFTASEPYIWNLTSEVYIRPEQRTRCHNIYRLLWLQLWHRSTELFYRCYCNRFYHQIFPVLCSLKWDYSEYLCIPWWIWVTWQISIISLLFRVRKFQWRITELIYVAYIYKSHLFFLFSTSVKVSVLRITDIRYFCICSHILF
jgi:hypothetical protein